MSAQPRLKHQVPDGDGGAFLGVMHSARGFQWRERLQPAGRLTADAIARRPAAAATLPHPLTHTQHPFPSASVSTCTVTWSIW